MGDINIKDVAIRAGVSAMTVTRTINNPDLVKESTRLKVQQAIRELGYIPDRTAIMLRSGKSNTIGIALFDIENPFISKLVMQMERKLKKHNYSVLISCVNEEDSDDFDIYANLKSFNVDLSIFIPTLYNKKVAELSLDASSKCLQLFRMGYSTMDAFVIDDVYGAYLATKYLLENGHERILLIDFDQRMPLNRDHGYLQAFREAGKTESSEMILQLPEFCDDTYEDQITQAILDKKPTAILAVTQKLCESSINAIKSLDLQIYDDISLIGYDDTILARHLGITTIAHPFDEMIDKMTEWVIGKVSGTGSTEVTHIKVKPYLNIRSSVKTLSSSQEDAP